MIDELSKAILEALSRQQPPLHEFYTHQRVVVRDYAVVLLSMEEELQPHDSPVGLYEVCENGGYHGFWLVQPYGLVQFFTEADPRNLVSVLLSAHSYPAQTYPDVASAVAAVLPED
jgi:hypothetical protein